MAIYHCSTKAISRTSGRSAVASSAYRAGEKLVDDRTGLTHDFTKKEGVAHSEIISNFDVKIDRSELWNMAEQAENRKDARTAREWVIALPDELDKQQRQDLAKEFAQKLVDKYGVIADMAIHEPSKHGSDKNHHAHIMLTTRQAMLDGDKVKLTNKADIELSNAKRAKLELGTTQDEIKEVRELWANLANRALERAGKEQRIDHRSYDEQGNGLKAQWHENNAVTELRRQGIVTAVSKHNDEVKAYNAKELERQAEKQERQPVQAQGEVKPTNRLDGLLQQRETQLTAQEQARQEQLRRQAEQHRAERASRHSSRDSGGMER